MFSFLISYELLMRQKNGEECVFLFRNSLDKIISMLRFGQYNVFEICETVFEAECFSQKSGCFTEQWNEFCKEHMLDDTHDISLIERVGEILGSCDSESQIEQIAYIRDELSASYSKKHAETERKRRIYLSLGCFGGMMICILLI